MRRIGLSAQVGELQPEYGSRLVNLISRNLKKKESEF